MKRVVFLVVPLAALMLVYCKKHNTPAPANVTSTEVPVDTVIHITALSAPTLEADSVSTCLITVQLHPTTTPRENFVVFNTTLGQFPNGQKTDTAAVDVYGVAVLPLLSNTVGSALISATVDAISVDATVSFIPALPDGMYCVATPSMGSDSINFQLICDLYRNPGRGKVTDPIQVSFSLLPPVTGNYGAPMLSYPPVATSISGVVTDSVKDPFYNKGSFVIVAATTLDNGNSFSQPIYMVIN
jgi:hypothetical protein